MNQAKFPAVLAALALCAHAATIPRKAAPLTIKTPDGKQLLLSDYKGKVVVLAFILTTCPHCQAVTQVLVKQQHELGTRGLQVIESAIDEKPAKLVQDFIRRYETPFPVGFNDYAVAASFMEHPTMKIMHMPALAFLDREGTIVAQYQGDNDFMVETHLEENLRKQILKMLGPAAPVKKAPVKKSGAAVKKGS